MDRKLGRLIAAMCFLPALAGCGDYEATPAEQAAARVQDMTLMACLASQREVKRALKSPGSAQFPDCSFNLHEYQITANPEYTKFGVQGYVDAQNSYGASTRSRFVVMLDKGPGDGSADFRASKVTIE